MKKQDKLALIEQLLLAHPGGLKRAEIAEKIGAHRATAGRCVDDLTRTLPILEEDARIFIDRTRYLNNIKLTLHEVFCLYLSARLLALTFNRYSPHVYSGMNKLAEALKIQSPLLGGFISLSAAQLLENAGAAWKDHTAIVEKLTLAWAENKKAVILYRSKTKGEIHKYAASIYFMEPYPAGKSLYLFAKTDGEDFVRTFRVERITAVEVTRERYTVPADFDFRSMFSNAWAIWDSRGEKTKVTLRFSSRVAERAGETVWHPSQEVKPDKSGGALFTAAVSEPLEMVPWIRGWGSDCEVLTPASLRQFMREEAGKLGAMYG